MAENLSTVNRVNLSFASDTSQIINIALTYKTSKVREPYSVVQFLAERLDIPPLLGLPPSPEDDEVENWDDNGVLWCHDEVNKLTSPLFLDCLLVLRMMRWATRMMME